MTDLPAEGYPCHRCRALIPQTEGDLAAHEDFCARMWALLPYRRCDAPSPVDGASSCHAGKGHAGMHIHEAAWRRE